MESVPALVTKGDAESSDVALAEELVAWTTATLGVPGLTGSLIAVSLGSYKIDTISQETRVENRWSRTKRKTNAENDLEGERSNVNINRAKELYKIRQRTRTIMVKTRPAM